MVLPPQDIHNASAEALFRYRVVSEVLAYELDGDKRAEAVRKGAGKSWLHFDGKVRRVSKRSIRRWLAAFEGRTGDTKGLRALEPAERQRIASSLVLPPAFLKFIAEQKAEDLAASIPELIRRARELGIIAQEDLIDRSTAFRAARRLGIPTKRCKHASDRDSRRFAHAHRMDCVLCDGKHFRAGVERNRRMAYFFLDDATRMGLHVVVGTSENEALFLRGLYELIRKHGFMNKLYLDGGPGFVGLDTCEVVAGFPALLLHGEDHYPEGHGKAERLNRTAKAQCLRHMDGRPDVDAACGALELRIGHYLYQQYNHTPHESLGLKAPWDRFRADGKALRLPESDVDLRRHFVVHFERTVSNDHVVSIDGVSYEMPLGYRERKARIHHRLLDGSYAVVHCGRLVDLEPVDLVANARSPRARGTSHPADEEAHPLPPSAADLHFDRVFGPVVAADGGFADPEPNKE